MRGSSAMPVWTEEVLKGLLNWITCFHLFLNNSSKTKNIWNDYLKNIYCKRPVFSCPFLFPPSWIYTPPSKYTQPFLIFLIPVWSFLTASLSCVAVLWGNLTSQTVIPRVDLGFLFSEIQLGTLNQGSCPIPLSQPM